MAPAPGLARSHEAEVEGLVTDMVGRRARVRCRVVGRPAPGTSRFACTTLERRYRVDWEDYGTGRYVIHVVDRAGRSQRVQQGTLSISE